MLVISRSRNGHDGQELLALQLFNGLVHERRPVDVVSRGHFRFISAALVVALPILFFVLGLRISNVDRMTSWLGKCAGLFEPSAVPGPRPGVLVVTANAVNQFDVTATAEPRGYAVSWETTATSGLNRLRSAPQQFSIVVLDAAVPGSNAIALTIAQSWPEKHLILLKGPHRPAILAQSLLRFL